MMRFSKINRFRLRRLKLRKKIWISPLTKRVLAVNIISLIILLSGLLYIDQYRKSLLRSELEALNVQARIFADTLGELAVETGIDNDSGLLLQPARDMIRRIVPPTQTRARVFDKHGTLLIDSRVLGGKKTKGKGKNSSLVQIEDLDAAKTKTGFWHQTIQAFMDEMGSQSLSSRNLPMYEESSPQTALDYEETREALTGNSHAAIRRLNDEGDLILSVATPIQHYKQVLGVLMVSKTSEHIENIMAEVWQSTFQVFGIALLVTLLLSAYLANTLSRPIVRLADAANKMRTSKNRNIQIPDLSKRHDEIGDLSLAMRDLTTALWQRLDAIENFAADVAHEIKNPLNSLRSAVETVSRLDDPKKQKQLLQIIFDDVLRLDRLITDISEASRVDSDMSKAQIRAFDIVQVLAPLVQSYGEQQRGKDIRIDLFVDPTLHFQVLGTPGRITQVMRNLLDNAISFSPKGGVVGVHIQKYLDQIEIAVTDQGPGIPADRLEKIFDRFYTDRPSGEKFGLHSGLGLSISKQIVTAMGGSLVAENIQNTEDKISGARFRILLPAA